MELLDEWKIATQDGGNFDLSHFYTLFHWKFSRGDADQILQNFPERTELLERLMAYKEPKTTVSDEVLLELVRLDVAETSRLCKEIEYGQELILIFQNLEYVFVNESEFMAFSEQFDEPIVLQETIGDHLIYATVESKRNDWLLEAYYGLTTTPQLVWYLGKPLYESSFNPDLYFDIWKNSGDYYLGGGKVFVLNQGSA